jgi:protein arginine kinase activator
MMCQRCGQRAATTHIKTVVNGQLSESHLCSVCAKEQGYGHLLSEWNGFGGLLSGLLSGLDPAVKEEKREEKRCPGCGSSFSEISRSGKLGCGQCYSTFRNRLIPVIERLHGASQHKGKVPGGSALRVQEENRQLVSVDPSKGASEIEEKKRLLQKAVEAQDFERAAVLRDQIKELESHE